MKKKILVLYSNPNKKSFGTALGKEYIKGIKTNKHQVKEIYLNDLKFDLRQKGFKSKQKLEKDLLKVQKLIIWADNIVFCYPIWWQGIPAVLKGLFDRILIPNFAFKYEGKLLPKGLLKPKKVRNIVTLDSPIFYYKLIGRNPDKIMMKSNMNFCGIKIIGHHYFGSIRKSDEDKRKKWLNDCYKIGLKE